MIEFSALKNFFPPAVRDDAHFAKSMLKEYVQLLVLDFLSTSPSVRQMAFIGGTSLRLLKGIDRFSEDLDFDCKGLSKEAFMQTTDDVIAFLNRNGLKAQAYDRNNPKLKAFRRNIQFPGLLHELGLSGHREEMFLLKIECQDQGFDYPIHTALAKGCGFFFPIPVPPDTVLCAMKLCAMLKRSKGRDFYDAMFLLQMTRPDYAFLTQVCGIHNLAELKVSTAHLLETVDLAVKQRDCEHLLFSLDNSRRILLFGDFIQTLSDTPFNSEANRHRLKKSIRQLGSGKGKAHELIQD